MAGYVKALLEVALLLTTSLSLLATIVINGLASRGDADKFGLKNATGKISDTFPTQVTPAGYTFSIWGVIYAWQILWLGYGWSFTCRQSTQRTIFSGVYVGFITTCFINITWIFVWGNEHIDAALALLILFNLVMYPTILMLAVYLERVRGLATKVDVWLTRILPLNGLCFYATWTTIASLVSVSIVAQHSSGQSPADSGTITLVLLTITVIVYFILENTLLDRFFRYVLSVYPVVIWALIGVLSKHWDDDDSERNNIFGLILLTVVFLLFVGRIAIFITYSIFRPLEKRSGGYQVV